MWTNASMDNGTCVEVAWVTASAGNGACVDVAGHDGQVLIRDSKDPDGPRLAFRRDEWDVFLAGCKAGVFDQI
jgi:hypothetical protein